MSQASVAEIMGCGECRSCAKRHKSPPWPYRIEYRVRSIVFFYETSKMNSQRTTTTLLIGIAFVCLAKLTEATPYVPPTLSPGDNYHLVFITDGVRDATSSLVNDYNTFVNLQAALNPGVTGTSVGVQYRAIVSTTATAANVNAPVSAPVYNLNGDKIADNFTDMWDGTIDNPIAYNQFVATVFPPDIWTGSQTSGQPFIGNELGLTNPRTGRSDLAAGTWISETTSVSTFNSRIYGLSQQLTVVPEPSVSTLATLAAITVIGQRRRKQHLTMRR